MKNYEEIIETLLFQITELEALGAKQMIEIAELKDISIKTAATVLSYPPVMVTSF